MDYSQSHMMALATTFTNLPMTLSRSEAAKCLVCGKVGCPLRSHKSYASSMLVRYQQTPSQHDLLQLQDSMLVPQQIENPRTDPFEHYPVEMSVGEYRLLDLWYRPWDGTHEGPSRHLFPMPAICLFTPYAVKSPAFFRSVLAMSAAQSALARGSIDEVSYRQQASAVSLHAKVCQDEKTATSDENIMTALCIMSNNLAHGNLKEAVRHRDGIDHLVRARGGPHYLGMDGVVAAALMFADHAASVYQLKKPVWSIPLPSLRFPTEIFTSAGSKFKRLDLDHRLLEMLNDLSRLTRVFVDKWGKKTTMDTWRLTSYLAEVSEYQLAELTYFYRDQVSKSVCVCAASLLFDHIILRNVGAINAGIRVLEYRFWDKMHKAQTEGVWSEQDKDDHYLIIWMVLTALSVSIRAPSQQTAYAFELLRSAKDRCGIQSFDGMRKVALDPFLWFPAAQESTFRIIWRDVQRNGDVATLKEEE